MAFGTLVDSNVLLDVITEDKNWFDWSSSALASAADEGPLFINPIIYAEVSVRFSRSKTSKRHSQAQIMGDSQCHGSRHSSPGKYFWTTAGTGGPDGRRFRISSLVRTPPSLASGLTRDAIRYRTYFPAVQLTSPDRPFGA